MGLFDKLKNTAASAVGGAVNNAAMSIGNKSETFTFTALPESLAQMQSQPSIHSFSRGKGFRQGCRDRTLCGLCRTQSPQSVLIGIENNVKSNMVYTLCKHMVYMLSITNEHKNELEMRAKPEWKVHFLCFASAKRGSFSIR